MNTDLIARARDWVASSDYAPSNSLEALLLELADALEAAQPAGEPVAMFGLQAKDGRFGNWAYSVREHAELAVTKSPPSIGYKVVEYHTHPAPQVPSKTELADMRDNLFSLAEALQPHTQAMYDEAVFTGHMNRLDDRLPQCVTTLEEANKHYYFLSGYLSNWRPSQMPMTDAQIDLLWDAHKDAPTMSYRYLVTRAIEAHHKIGVKP